MGTLGPYIHSTFYVIAARMYATYRTNTDNPIRRIHDHILSHSVAHSNAIFQCFCCLLPSLSLSSSSGKLQRWIFETVFIFIHCQLVFVIRSSKTVITLPLLSRFFLLNSIAVHSAFGRWSREFQHQFVRLVKPNLPFFSFVRAVLIHSFSAHSRNSQCDKLSYHRIYLGIC